MSQTLLKIRQHALADPRKTVVLGVLFVLFVFILIHNFILPRTPGSAIAMSVSHKDSNTNKTVCTVTDMTGIIRERVKLSKPLTRELIRDPFSIDLTVYQLDPSVVSEASGTSATSDKIDQNKSIKDAIAELDLRGTTYGNTSVACINGQLVRPGDEVAGFVLEQIQPSYVVLRRGNSYFKLFMK